ncbi:MAG TPA: c-type cytochrome biogenesis protein CcmI [Rhizomicrobium sp.]
MILWAVMTVMIAVAASALTIPLVRRNESRARSGTVEVLKAQLEDIDGQVASGALPSQEADAQRAEIKRRLLVEARQEDSAPRRPVPQRALPWVALAVASAVALAATGLYAIFGSPNVPSVAPLAPVGDVQTAQANPHAGADITTLIAQLEAKMREHPGDPEGWRMLGWSYMQTGRAADAATAYAHAAALDPKNADYLSAEGEALTQAGGGQVTPAALAAFRRAVTVNASDPRARYFLAAVKDEQGDHAGAIAAWIALLKSAPVNAPWAAQVRNVIERTAQQYNVDIAGKLPAAPEANPASPSGVVSGSAPPGPTPEQLQDAGRMSESDRQAMIRGMVGRLAAELKDNPRNEQGWVRLMRAHMVLGDPAAAAAAYRTARQAFAGQQAETTALDAAARELRVPGA